MKSGCLPLPFVASWPNDGPYPKITTASSPATRGPRTQRADRLANIVVSLLVCLNATQSTLAANKPFDQGPVGHSSPPADSDSSPGTSDHPTQPDGRQEGWSADSVRELIIPFENSAVTIGGLGESFDSCCRETVRCLVADPFGWLRFFRWYSSRQPAPTGPRRRP